MSAVSISETTVSVLTASISFEVVVEGDAESLIGKLELVLISRGTGMEIGVVEVEVASVLFNTVIKLYYLCIFKHIVQYLYFNQTLDILFALKSKKYLVFFIVFCPSLYPASIICCNVAGDLFASLVFGFSLQQTKLALGLKAFDNPLQCPPRSSAIKSLSTSHVNPKMQ